jgi:hypothetical protein
MFLILLLVPTLIIAVNQPDPHEADVQSYARAFGISNQEAANCLNLELAARRLDEELSLKERETFGGLWIQHKPVFRIIVLFTEDGQEKLERYISDDLRAFVEVRTCGLSLEELSSVQGNILAALRSLNIPADTCINVYKGIIEVNIARSHQDVYEAAVEAGKITSSDNVDFQVVDQLAVPY